MSAGELLGSELTRMQLYRVTTEDGQTRDGRFVAPEGLSKFVFTRPKGKGGIFRVHEKDVTRVEQLVGAK